MVYDTLKGTVSYLGLTSLTLDVNDVGYRLLVPISTLSKVQIDKPLQLFVSYIVRENSHTLYGFCTRDDRDLFEELLNVSGVGPKIACAVLSYMTYDQFVQAVTVGDDKQLLRVPGLGKKSVNRLILDIKDKLPKITLNTAASTSASSILEDATSALVNLGFTSAVATNMLKSAVESGASEDDVESLLRYALQSSR